MTKLFEKPFKSMHIDVQGTLKRGGKTTIEWFYDQAYYGIIEDFATGCGCTADVKKLGDRVRATFTDTSMDEAFHGDTQEFTKTVTVFYDDGKPLMVKNNRGVEQYNTEKAQDVLTFTVKVKKK